MLKNLPWTQLYSFAPREKVVSFGFWNEPERSIPHFHFDGMLSVWPKQHMLLLAFTKVHDAPRGPALKSIAKTASSISGVWVQVAARVTLPKGLAGVELSAHPRRQIDHAAQFDPKSGVSPAKVEEYSSNRQSPFAYHWMVLTFKGPLHHGLSEQD